MQVDNKLFFRNPSGWGLFYGWLLLYGLIAVYTVVFAALRTGNLAKAESYQVCSGLLLTFLVLKTFS